MSNGKETGGGVLADVNKNVGFLFRHLFPGVLIFGASYVAHPLWFKDFDVKSWQHLVLSAVIALTIGNVWYAVNRYCIHQILDYVAYLLKSPGPERLSGKQWEYLDDIGKYAAKSLQSSNRSLIAAEHIAVRGASVLLLYTIAEVGFLFILWHDPNNDNFFDKYSGKLPVLSTLIFCAGIWQNLITRHIDYAVTGP
jgi:hypothetical protein